MNTWPLQKDCRKFYGAPGSNQTQIVPPYALYYDGKLVKKITINRKCADSAVRVLESVAQLYTAKDRASLGFDKFAGCFNNRPMRGGTQLSMHAFACAIDFDPARNQLKMGKPEARFSHPDCEGWWQMWELEGWVSLGRARNFDWMHVQAARLV